VSDKLVGVSSLFWVFLKASLAEVDDMRRESFPLWSSVTELGELDLSPQVIESLYSIGNFTNDKLVY
jgi:hypothetical protein